LAEQTAAADAFQRRLCSRFQARLSRSVRLLKGEHMQGMGAVAIFLITVLVWRSIYVKHGNIGFWQLAADQPDAA
jgi:hypothetical protein